MKLRSERRLREEREINQLNINSMINEAQGQWSNFNSEELDEFYGMIKELEIEYT